MQMTVQKALTEIKMLDNRINRAIQNSVLGGYIVGKKPMTGYNTTDEIVQRAKSDYQSVTDLIKRRNQIKSKVVLSNATTEVTVAGKTMTRAEAIERKDSISFDQALLNKMKNVYSQLVNKVDAVNNEAKLRLDKQLEVLYGKDGKAKVDESADIVKLFNESNEAKLIDPLNLKEQIEKLEKDIEDFLSEIDSTLVESNVMSTIEIDD